jgi:hypothetical protein
MSQSDEKSSIAPESGGPALLPPPVKPAKSVLRSIAALDAAEDGDQKFPGAGRRPDAPVIDGVATEDRPAPSADAGKAGDAVKPDAAPRVSAAKAEPVKPLRASAFRPNGGAPEPKPVRKNAWMLRAAGVAVLVGAGWTAAAHMSSGSFNLFGATEKVAKLSPMEQLHADIRQLSGELGAIRTQLAKLDSPEQRARQSAELDALKRSLADLSRRIEQGRTAQTAAVTEIGARLDRARNDETKQREEISERIARIERQISDGRPTATQASVLPNSTTVPRVAVTPPPLAGEGATARKPQGLAGYVLREVYNGTALIEGRNGYLEVYPGSFVPGAGRVQQITRRAGQWVVVTSNGVIGSQIE